jgi:hypothetical protein
MTQEQVDALCEYADGRREAGERWDVIAERLSGSIDEAVLEQLEELHRKWKGKQAYVERQLVAGDARVGCSVGAVVMDAVGDVAGAAGEEAADVSLSERAEALRVVSYLKSGLLQARYRWRYHGLHPIDDGETVEDVRGPGSVELESGDVVCWWVRGVVVRSAEGCPVRAWSEARARKIIPEQHARPSWAAQKLSDPRRHVQLERIDLDGEVVDAREISARLAAVLHTFLGSQGSPWRNNAELAEALGVSRQAIQMRRRRLLKAAGARTGDGIRSTEGL